MEAKLNLEIKVENFFSVIGCFFKLFIYSPDYFNIDAPTFNENILFKADSCNRFKIVDG